MKIFGFKFIVGIVALASIFAARASAELVWTKDEGWQVQGGVLSNVFGENLNIETALQAMNEAKRAQDEGENRLAIKLYQHVIHNYANSIFAPEAYYQAGTLYSAEGMFAEAYDCFQRIIKYYPNYPKFNLVIGKEFALATNMKDGQMAYLWGWMPWVTDYNEAIKIYESVVTNAPFSDYAPLALMNIAVVADDMDKPEIAIDALDRLINTYPQNIFAPDAYLQMAYTYRKMVDGPEYDQGSVLKAVDYYQDFLILFPDNLETPTAEAGLELMMDVHARSRLCMGDFYYYYRNNMKAATIFYNETITIAPNSLAAKEAQKQLKKIADGELPPMTPADWFMGRCEPPVAFDYSKDVKLQKIDPEQFEEKSASSFVDSNESTSQVSEKEESKAEGESPKSEASEKLESSEKADSSDSSFTPVADPDLQKKIDSEGFVGE